MVNFIKNKMKNDRKGSALIEMVMVMTLLTLFGVTIFQMIISGADAQKLIMSQKDAQTEARIALAYIDMSLRQNDSHGKINVKQLDATGENAIVIKLFEDSDIWIYRYEGMLYEALTDSGSQPGVVGSWDIDLDLAGQPIADVKELEIGYDEETSLVNVTISYDYYNNETKELSEETLTSNIYLRSK